MLLVSIDKLAIPKQKLLKIISIDINIKFKLTYYYKILTLYYS